MKKRSYKINAQLRELIFNEIEYLTENNRKTENIKNCIETLKQLQNQERIELSITNDKRLKLNNYSPFFVVGITKRWDVAHSRANGFSFYGYYYLIIYRKNNKFYSKIIGITSN